MITTPLCFRVFVRYIRKPIWMPTANSKLFRIAEHTFYSPDEVKQIQLLQRAYRAQEESIQEFMKREFFIPASQAGGLPQEFINREAELDKKIYEENDQINAKIAKEKEEFMGKMIRDMEEKLLAEKQRIEEELLERTHQVDQYVREQKAEPHSFVTPDNIEELIDKAMANPVTYEFYIDTSGRRYLPAPSTDSQPKQSTSRD